MKFKELKSLFVAATILLSPVEGKVASAQMAQPTNIFVKPVPEIYRRTYSDFLTRFGEKDVETSVAETKFVEIGQNGAMAFRLEQLNCVDCDCLTIIGRIRDREFRSELMFMTGPKATNRDALPIMFGKTVFPILFYGKNGVTTLIETSEGWVVATSPN